MKYYLTLLLLLSVQMLIAQYIQGIAPDSIELLYAKVEDEKRVSNYSSCKEASDRLLDYWSQQKNSVSTETSYQNYFSVLYYDLKFSIALDLLELDTIPAIIALEDSIGMFLPENIIALAQHNYLVSELFSKLDKNRKTRVQYLNKALSYLENDEKSTHPLKLRILNGLSNAHCLDRKFQEGKAYAESSLLLNENLSQPDTSQLIGSLYQLAIVGYYDRNYEWALTKSMRGLELAHSYLQPEHSDISKLTRLTGIFNGELGNFRQNLKYALQALELKKGSGEEPSKGISRYYSTVSGVYQRLGEFNLAITYADSAIVFSERDDETLLLSNYYHNKALLVKNSDEAIKLFHAALDLCQEGGKCSDGSYSILIQNLGNEYYVSGRILQALNYVTKAKAIKEKNYKSLGVYLPSTYGSMALIHESLGELDIAIQYQEKSLAVVKEFRAPKSFHVATELSRLGKYYVMVDRLDKASRVLHEAEKILEASAGTKNEQTILTYKYLSSMYEKKGQKQIALDYTRKALNNDWTSFPPINSLAKIVSLHHEMCNQDSVSHYAKLLLDQSGMDFYDRTFSSKENGVYSLWERFSAYFEYLKLDARAGLAADVSLERKLTLGFKFIEDMRSGFFFDVSEVEFQENVRLFYNWSLRQLSSQYQESKDDKLLNLIFQSIERSKSIVINRNSVRSRSLWAGRLPEELLSREKKLIQAYSSTYDKYRNAYGTDSIQLVYSDSLFRLESEKSDFLEDLENDYPDYYSDRYKQNSVSLDELQQYAEENDVGVLLTHWGDSLAYRFVITATELDYRTVPLNELSSDLSVIDKALTYKQQDKEECNFSTSQREFALSSHGFCETFIGSEVALPSDLICIPDGEIVNLPFEILLTALPDSTMGYKSFPYLLRDHSISYLGSCSKLLSEDMPDRKSNKLIYGGFAPSYDLQLSERDTLVFSPRNESLPLLYNIEEVETCSALLDGDRYVGRQATELSFREKADKYRVLHLAMHATVNDAFPMESYLNFSQDSIGDEDSRLLVEEIARMNLNCDLVVLSACETNIGGNASGEGALGIARAFNLAACSNLVMSNWLVDDRSSSKIMSSFFRGLSDNLAPAACLRTAKLNFLKQSSTVQSHPRYWAAYSYYGSPLIAEPRTEWGMAHGMLGVLLIGLIAVLLFRRL